MCEAYANRFRDLSGAPPTLVKRLSTVEPSLILHPPAVGHHRKNTPFRNLTSWSLPAQLGSNCDSPATRTQITSKDFLIDHCSVRHSHGHSLAITARVWIILPSASMRATISLQLRRLWCPSPYRGDKLGLSANPGTVSCWRRARTAQSFHLGFNIMLTALSSIFFTSVALSIKGSSRDDYALANADSIKSAPLIISCQDMSVSHGSSATLILQAPKVFTNTSE